MVDNCFSEIIGISGQVQETSYENFVLRKNVTKSDYCALKHLKILCNFCDNFLAIFERGQGEEGVFNIHTLT